MNLELLFWAADHGGRPEWRDIALQHALTTARWHLRADGSTFQVVRFDESTGQPVWAGTAAGALRLLDLGPRPGLGGARLHHGVPRDRRPAAARRGPQGRGLRRRRMHRPTGCRGGTTTRPAPGATRRPRPCRRRACSSWPGSTRTLPAGRPGGPPACTPSAHWSDRATSPGAPAPWSILLHGRHDPTYDDAGVTYGDYYLLEALLRVQLLPSTGRPSRWRAPGALAGGGLRADLGSRRRVSAVSVRWAAGASTATRFRVQTSVDGRRWTTVRGGVSSGRTTSFETYDLRDRVTRFVRVRAAGHEHRCTAAGSPSCASAADRRGSAAVRLRRGDHGEEAEQHQQPRDSQRRGDHREPRVLDLGVLQPLDGELVGQRVEDAEAAAPR